MIAENVIGSTDDPRFAGRPVEYVRIPHEGHGFARIENRRTVFGGVARFLREHL